MIAGPSGAGKSTIVSALLQRRPDIALSISATTREARPGERDGVNYLFLGAEEFDRMQEAGEFLETAVVHGNRYGTPRRPVEEALRAGGTVVLEIDVQGARSVRAQMPEALLIFVEPPSWDVLQQRLESRNTESPEALAIRLRNAGAEIADASWFDHRVVNDDLGRAVDEIVRILDGT